MGGQQRANPGAEQDAQHRSPESPDRHKSSTACWGVFSEKHDRGAVFTASGEPLQDPQQHHQQRSGQPDA